MEEAVFRCEVLETGIGKPIVQRSHPTALRAFAHKFGKAVDAGNIAAACTGNGDLITVDITFIGRSFNSSHHSRVFIQFYFLIDQDATPGRSRFAIGRLGSIGKGRIFNNDANLTFNRFFFFLHRRIAVSHCRGNRIVFFGPGLFHLGQHGLNAYRIKSRCPEIRKIRFIGEIGQLCCVDKFNGFGCRGNLVNVVFPGIGC